MKILINGEEREISPGTTLGELLKELDIPLAGTAVEVNREIVPKRTLDETPVAEGDSIEVIRMVGGG